MIKFIESKRAKELFILICEVLANKGIDINQMKFNGMNGTNTMSGEHGVLQRRFRHKVLPAKYVNFCNHKLGLVFVHLLHFKVFHNIDIVLLSCC